MKALIKAILAFSALSALMSSCATGPDSSPEVMAHAMSYSGLQPTAVANGNIVGMRATGTPPQRKTIFD